MQGSDGLLEAGGLTCAAISIHLTSISEFWLFLIGFDSV